MQGCIKPISQALGTISVKTICSEHTYRDHSWGCLLQLGMKHLWEGILKTEDSMTLEEEDTNSQDFNISTDHSHLVWNCLMKINNVNKNKLGQKTCGCKPWGGQWVEFRPFWSKNHFFILLNKFNLHTIIYDSLKFETSITVLQSFIGSYVNFYTI